MPVFAVTIFLSAFLLFQVQPLIAKYILPWFGGGAGVWTVCLLFFQTVLLAGYAYAHALTRWLRPRGQILVHLALLAATVISLPIVPAEAWKSARTVGIFGSSWIGQTSLQEPFGKQPNREWRRVPPALFPTLPAWILAGS